MGWVDISYYGSFQRGRKIISENPGREIWNSLEHFGTIDFLLEQKPENSSLDWPYHCQYASLRVAQAIEFREAAKVGSPLSSPVSSYYSMLNLVRAFLAVKQKIIPTKSHGLRFVGGKGLFECSAKVSKGTFHDYLSEMGVENPQTPISLSDCFRSIVEISQEVASTNILGGSWVCPVIVEIWKNGKAQFSFQEEFIPKAFREVDWKRAFPEIWSDFSQDSANPFLFTSSIEPDSQKTGLASEFCEKYLMPDLWYLDFPRWFILQEETPCYGIPRLGNYLVAMFILSNVCRYEPQLLKDVFSISTEVGWLVRRFLEQANRYYPQLVLSWVQGTNVFSKTA